MRGPGAETHDGFYLRLHLGGGYTNMTASSGADSLKVAGGGIGFGVAVGGAIAPNLIIYGTIVTSQAENPDTSVNDMSLGSSSGSAGVEGIGPGLAYYIQPSNVFFAASLLGSRLTFTDNAGNRTANTNVGFTFEGMVGKEWWVSDNWGLGVSGELMLGAMKDKAIAGVDGPTWHVVAFNVLFSATFN
jgi:hypothetical protein